MLKFDREQVLANIRQADTDDLLDRVTAYRPGMEPAAVDLIEAELARRGVKPDEIAEHRLRCRDCLYHPDGTAQMCSFCRRPAIACGWGWHWLRGLLPVLPRRFRYCEDHVTSARPRADSPRPV